MFFSGAKVRRWISHGPCLLVGAERTQRACCCSIPSRNQRVWASDRRRRRRESESESESERARERENEKTRERARAGERESERARERESERAAEEGQGGWVPVPGDRSDVGLCAVALVVREAVLRPFLAWSQQCSQGAARQSCCRTVGCTQRHRKPPGGSSLAIRTCCDDHAIPGHFRDDRCRCDREDLGVA